MKSWFNNHFYWTKENISSLASLSPPYTKNEHLLRLNTIYTAYIYIYIYIYIYNIRGSSSWPSVVHLSLWGLYMAMLRVGLNEMQYPPTDSEWAVCCSCQCYQCWVEVLSESGLHPLVWTTVFTCKHLCECTHWQLSHTVLGSIMQNTTNQNMAKKSILTCGLKLTF